MLSNDLALLYSRCSLYLFAVCFMFYSIAKLRFDNFLHLTNMNEWTNKWMNKWMNEYGLIVLIWWV